MMNTEDINDFKSYGCTSRCILFLTARNGVVLSIEDFVTRYNSLFKMDQGKKRAGLISRRDAKFICKDLGIASSTQCFLKLSDIPKIKLNGILVFTEKKPEPDGTLSDYNHCGLIDPSLIDPSTLRYGQVGQTLQADFEFLPESSFDMLVPEYVILIP